MYDDQLLPGSTFSAASSARLAKNALKNAKTIRRMPISGPPSLVARPESYDRTLCSGPAVCARGSLISGSMFCSRCYDSLECLGGLRYHPGLSMKMEGRMSLLSSATVLSLVDSMAIVLSQAYL